MDSRGIYAAKDAQETRKLAANFEESIGQRVSHLSATTTQMEASARAMAGTAAITNAQSQTVSAAVRETSVNVQIVASATEELSASASEIGSQVAQPACAAAHALETARATQPRSIEKLSTFSVASALPEHRSWR